MKEGGKGEYPGEEDLRGGEGEEEDLGDPVGKDLAGQDPKEEEEEEEADLQKRKLLKKKI